MSEFQDKVVVVAGGGRGIGWAVAEAVARAGAKLAIVDSGCAPDGSGHDPSVAAQAVETLSRRGTEALALDLDCGLPESAPALVAAVKARFGRIDAGVYCAGFHHERPLLRSSDADFERVLAVSLWGAIRFTRELARSWVSDKHDGAVVVATSAAGYFGSANQGAMATAAGGLIGFVKTAATELRRQSVRVNAVVPTARTRLTEHLPLFESIRPDSLTSEHVAQVICHLLSARAADVRGEVIGVAGGRIYAYRHGETSGAFHDGPPATLDDIHAAWRDVTKR